MHLGRIIAGKYCLLHELGRGGMGSVWAAEHILLRSKVAIKLIEPQILGGLHAQERFEREARALATLRSANVVQVLDDGVDDGVQYLVMELTAELQTVLDAPASSSLGNDPQPVLEDELTLRVDAAASSPFERRAGARVISSIPAAIDGQRDLRNTALIYNTSRSGALLATRRSWACEQAITLTLHLDSAYDGETVLAHIVRVTPRDAGLWKFDVAVRFAEPLAEEVLARIEARARARG